MRPADLDTPLMWISDQRVMTLHSPGVPSAGCARKGCVEHTSDWREPRGSEGNRHDVRAETHTTLFRSADGGALHPRAAVGADLPGGLSPEGDAAARGGDGDAQGVAEVLL